MMMRLTVGIDNFSVTEIDFALLDTVEASVYSRVHNIISQERKTHLILNINANIVLDISKIREP